MRIFLTGATGFIGSALVPELIKAGHQVLGLARSDAGAESLAAAGADVHRGDLEDVDSLARGAAKSDAVIHTGFIHDFSRFKEVCETDRRAIEALASPLAGSNRPLIITSGTGMGNAGAGTPASEDHFDPSHPNPRAVSEITAASVAARGVDVRVVRLPQVHDPLKQGLITYLVDLAREKGVSAYVGEGRNRWPAVHRFAAAQLYRLALEKGYAGARYHAVAEEGVPLQAIAEAVGRRLKVPVLSKSPEEAGAHFGWLAMFAAVDMPASSALTQKRLGWRPTGPRLIADLDHG
jgi:nucleoside-diphosphate-sugar epimerase